MYSVKYYTWLEQSSMFLIAGNYLKCIYVEPLTKVLLVYNKI